MHLDHINLQSGDPEALAGFYGRILDMDVTALDEGYRLCLAPGRKVLLSAGEPGLGFGAYACESEQELAELRARIVASGTELQTFVSPLFKGEESISVHDPDNNLLVFGLRAGLGGRSRVGASNTGADGEKETPLLGRLQHLVVATDQLSAMRAFYEEVVGFTLTDQVVDEHGEQKVLFFRGDHEHHCFAVFAASSKRLDHHCYEAGEWNLIRDWADHLVAHDVKIAWGPGRHGAGNNLFLMFNDRDGNWLEISAELETVTPDRQLGTWEHCEKTLNLWGKGMIRT